MPTVLRVGANRFFFYTPVIEMSPSISTWSVKTASPSSGSTRFVFKAVEASHESKSAASRSSSRSISLN